MLKFGVQFLNFYEKITDLETGLYYQSALYNYELFAKK